MRFLTIFLIFLASTTAVEAAWYDAIANWFRGATQSIENFFVKVANGANKAWDWIKNKAIAFGDRVKKLYESYVGDYMSKLKDAMNGVKDALNWLWERLKNGFTDDDIKKLKEIIMNVLESVLQYAEKKFHELMSTINKKIDAEIEKVTAYGEEIKNYIHNSTRLKLAHKCGEKFSKRIESYQEMTKHKLRECADKFINTLWQIYQFIKDVLTDIPDILGELRDEGVKCYYSIKESWWNSTCILDFILHIIGVVTDLVGSALGLKGLILRALKKIGTSGLCAAGVVVQAKITQSCFQEKVEWCLKPKHDKTIESIKAAKSIYKRNCLEEYREGLSELVKSGKALIQKHL